VPESAYGKNAPPAEKVPPLKFKGQVELDMTDPKSPIIRRDIAELLPTLQEKFVLEWAGEWWRFLPGDRDALIAFIAGQGYEVRIVPSHSSAPGTATAPGTGKAAERERSSQPHAAAPSAASTAAGTIERVQVDVKWAIVTLVAPSGRKFTWKCWDKDISDILRKNLGKLAEVILETRVSKGTTYVNLVGLKRVGEQEFEHGKMPILQNRNREAGAKTLF